MGILPAGALTSKPHEVVDGASSLPVSSVMDVLRSMDYDVRQLDDNVIGARSATMPNMIVAVTSFGLEIGAIWRGKPLVDIRKAHEAVNAANQKARCWRYSIDDDGDVLVDRFVEATSELSPEALKSIFCRGSVEMMVTIGMFLQDIVG